MQKLALPAAFVLCPELEGAGGHLGVGLIRPVGAPHDPRLSARRCPRIAGSPGVEQRDARAALEKMQSRPAAEGSGADHRDVWFGFHGKTYEDTRRMQESEDRSVLTASCSVPRSRDCYFGPKSQPSASKIVR